MTKSDLLNNIFDQIKSDESRQTDWILTALDKLASSSPQKFLDIAPNALETMKEDEASIRRILLIIDLVKSRNDGWNYDPSAMTQLELFGDFQHLRFDGRIIENVGTIYDHYLGSSAGTRCLIMARCLGLLSRDHKEKYQSFLDALTGDDEIQVLSYMKDCVSLCVDDRRQVYSRILDRLNVQGNERLSEIRSLKREIEDDDECGADFLATLDFSRLDSLKRITASWQTINLNPPANDEESEVEEPEEEEEMDEDEDEDD